MTTIKDIFNTYGPEYVQRFGDAMPNVHHKVINAIINCRTEYYGTMIYKCEKCGQSHIVFRSCGNRHCPNCQHHKTQLWIEKQMNRQLPGHHFMVTFTIPQELHSFIRSNQRKCYSAMFKTSSKTLKKLSQDEKYIGGDLPGFFGVLHTWGRMLQYHPHIHYIIPGGALSSQDDKWHPSRIDFYLPVKAMSKMFKAKFIDEMKKNGLYSKIPNNAWNKKWIVNCQAVGNGEQSIKYLAPYVFKVAISDSRIVKVENNKVFFKYKKSGSRRWRTTSLDVMEFIRRFLQHVLPTGFMKIRYYGFLHPNASVSLEKIAALIELTFGFKIVNQKKKVGPLKAPICPDCGGKLIYFASALPFRLIQAQSG